MFNYMGKRLQDNGESFGSLRHRTAAFSGLHGRRPRILITRITPTGSGRTVKSIATAFADMGFDVDINLSVQSPVDMVRIAVENDVHAIGIACVHIDSEPFVAELLTLLSAQCDQRILVVVWMHTPSDDFAASFASGEEILTIIDPKTGYSDSASRILANLE
jgi:methylmalonyl-CoA mutase